VIDGDAGLASALGALLPDTKVLEDYRHWKENAMDAIGGAEPHHDFSVHIAPLVQAATYDQFDEMARQLSQTMPRHLWRYLNQGAGPARRSPLQRLKCKHRARALGGGRARPTCLVPLV
jgi:hypothetical protein